MDFFTKLTSDPPSYADVLGYIKAHPWHMLGALAAGTVTYKVLTRPRNLPPGPRGLPLVGAMLQFTGDYQEDLIKLSNDYGDIASFYMADQ